MRRVTGLITVDRNMRSHDMRGLITVDGTVGKGGLVLGIDTCPPYRPRPVIVINSASMQRLLLRNLPFRTLSSVYMCNWHSIHTCANSQIRTFWQILTDR